MNDVVKAELLLLEINELIEKKKQLKKKQRKAQTFERKKIFHRCYKQVSIRIKQLYQEYALVVADK